MVRFGHTIRLALAAIGLTACASPEQPAASVAAQWTCPDGFVPKEGLNTNFPHEGMMRAFVLAPAKGARGLRLCGCR